MHFGRAVTDALLLTKKVFEPKHRVVFRAGGNEGDVVPGVEMAVQLMKEGQESEVKMLSRFGYGEAGSEKDPVVPPNADLVYTIELTRLGTCLPPHRKADCYGVLIPPFTVHTHMHAHTRTFFVWISGGLYAVDTMSDEEKLEEGTRLKNRGNEVRG